MIREDQIGRRIKKLRIERNLTQEALAQEAGLTKGYLSKIENSKNSPPVSTLLSLAKALGVNINDIFSEDVTATTITHLKKEERQTVARNGSAFGYSYEPLANKFPNRHMEPYILILPPEMEVKTPFQHKGEELLFVLEGTMRFFYEDKEFIVETEDSIYFDASVPHYGICEGKKPVKCVMVIYPEE
ncbi:MAG: helix-turn-helix transcriptional regulator [Desulfobacteraceae bacterium]|nr:MAG: helix-turn-helix transcriptional regulator [Desulfobacteraceae bacterium]